MMLFIMGDGFRSEIKDINIIKIKLLLNYTHGQIITMNRGAKVIDLDTKRLLVNREGLRIQIKTKLHIIHIITYGNLFNSFFCLKMESKKKWIFGPQEADRVVEPCDYIKNLGIPNINLDDSPHIICAGKSRSGKSSFISRMICHHFLHTIPIDNIYIFSPYFSTDKSFQRVRWTIKQILGKKRGKPFGADELPPTIFTKVNLKIIQEIAEKQMEIKNYNEHYNFNRNSGTLTKQQ